MKLEFENGIIQKDIFSELSFDKYLSLFTQITLPILGTQILKKLEKEDLINHFTELNQLKQKIESEKISLPLLIEYAEKLPSLSGNLASIKSKNIEMFDLFTLGKFLAIDQFFIEKENRLHAIKNSIVSSKILAILKEYLKNDFSNFLLTADENDLIDKLQQVDEILITSIRSVENEIYAKTNLTILYPYPRELSKNSDPELIKKIKQIELLTIKEKANLFSLEISLPSDILIVLEERNSIHKKIQELYTDKVKTVNNLLYNLYDEFLEYYSERKKRIWQYHLLFITYKNKFALPKISEEKIDKKIVCKNTKLLSLNKEFIPLNLTLFTGSNVLFGQNMTGKTTVLKNIYFQTILAHFGLPVIADEFSTSYFDSISIHLKTSGNLQEKRSSFADEIDFFCNAIKKDALILADELFHSTDPINGVLLSKIFIEEMMKLNVIFFCNSQYPEVLYIDGINLFRMKDSTINSETYTTDDILKYTPYEVEHISSALIEETLTNNKWALKIAYSFSLPKQIKEKIKSMI